VDVREILRDALDSIDEDCKKSIVVDTGSGFENVANFTANRMALLQIFIVLLTNAAESFQRAGIDTGTVTVDASGETVDGRQIFRIEFCDNGQGITELQLPHVFDRQFSVKPEGSSGIGLHWCANAMSAMNGRVRVRSAGEGKGACVSLEWFYPYSRIETEKGT
jgi:signal transduction histidine kinase